MSATIQIVLSPSAIALSEKFKRAPQEFPRAIARGMTRALQIVSGRIQEKRLTGHGPFPVTEHRLGERTGQLKLRTQSTPATVTSEGNESVITGAIGSSVFYAAFQEFGTKKTPERAPFRTGINENITYISGEIEKEIAKWEAL
jgi:HK97 gp10 family phage protein